MKKKIEDQFTDRVRFNWGYHDAAFTFARGFATPASNYGFGPSIKINEPSEVIDKHPDRSYACGWLFGLRDVKAGNYKENSTKAWGAFLHGKWPVVM